MKKKLLDLRLILYYLDKLNIIRINDELYLKILYKKIFNKELDLKNPKTFNEKLQWLKIYDRKKIYTTMVDKYEAKKYLANKIGKEYIIPTLGVYNKFDDIDFDKLPNQFVIKCTHDSGSVIICKDKINFDILNAKKQINKCLKKNYFYAGREWPYKDVKPRIIIEKYIKEDEDSIKELKDYKVFNFNGEPQIIQVDINRFSGHKKNIYTTEWKKLNISYNYEQSKNVNIEKPKNLNKMLELSKILSKDIPFLRTDFFVVNDKIYVGEMTFYPVGGFGKFKPSFWDRKLGELLRI